MNSKLPHSSGIYQIRCLVNGKIYVGSAVDLHDRWIGHRNSLRRGEHRNPHLQNAWNLYGEANFDLAILEYVDIRDLLTVEQRWIDETDCTNPEIGFNIYDIAGSPGDVNARIWEGFIDPDGNEVTIVNLYDFCRRNNSDWPSMHRLANGVSKLKSYKGWTHRNSIRQREYVKTYDGFIDLDGNPIGPVTNLAAFCREHGLDKTHMVAVAHGRLYSHRGWTYANDRQRLVPKSPKTYRGFISPDGYQQIITNLKQFCEREGLDVRRMYELASGMRKQYRGWTWKEEGSDE
jgi:hypothetical protein